MLRPRPAGFCYTETEIKTMFEDARLFLEHGTDGIVFGFLTKDNQVDVRNTKKMCDLIHSYHKEAVFHKAFDVTTDPDQAIEELIQCGVDRILTSGQKANVVEGEALIQKLIKKYSSRIEILPGGGVNAGNVKALVEHTGCLQVHMSAKSTFFDQENYYAVDAQKIAEVISILKTV